MAHRGLGHPQQRRQVAHADLRLQQDIEDAHAGAVAKGLEQVSQPQQLLHFRQALTHLLHHVLMDAEEGAGFYIAFGHDGGLLC